MSRILKYAVGASHTYSGGYRQWNASAAAQVSFVLGEAQPVTFGVVGEQTTGSGGLAIIGVAIDLTNTPNVTYSYVTGQSTISSTGNVLPAAGYHYIAGVESSASGVAATFASLFINGTVLA